MTLPEIEALILACPATDYQRAVLEGLQSWSGADLRGKAKRYSASYSMHRARLLEAIRQAVEPHGWHASRQKIRAEHGRISLVLEAPTGHLYRWTQKGLTVQLDGEDME